MLFCFNNSIIDLQLLYNEISVTNKKFNYRVFFIFTFFMHPTPDQVISDAISLTSMILISVVFYFLDIQDTTPPLK